jgi:hypothetical protein
LSFGRCGKLLCGSPSIDILEDEERGSKMLFEMGRENHSAIYRRLHVYSKSQLIIVQNVTQHAGIRGRNSLRTSPNTPQYMHGIIVQVTLATHTEFT